MQSAITKSRKQQSKEDKNCENVQQDKKPKMYIYFEFYNLNTMKKKTDDKKCFFIFKTSLLSL